MTLTPVEDYYSLWPWVRQGLLKAIGKTGDRFRPEDVYAMLSSRALSLYVYAETEPFAFLVVRREQDADGPALFVFAAWGAHPDREACNAELVKLARSIKAKRIRMWSPRKGFERDPFFTAKTVIYEHELDGALP